MTLRFLAIISIIITLLHPCVASAAGGSEFRYSDLLSPWSTRVRLGVATPSYAETYTPSTADDGNVDVLTSTPLIDIDVSYQISPHFSFAASLGYAFQSKSPLSITSGAQTVSDDSKISFIPTTYILRFHPAPYGKLNPYVGVGYNYVFALDTFTGSTINNGKGIVFQAGVDYWFSNQYLFNFDVKQLSTKFNVDYSQAFTNQTVKARYTYDPLYVSAGFGVRF